MPAASEPVGAPGGGDGEDVEQEEYEIRNDEGFVYKVARGLYPDAAPSSSQPAAGPDPRAAGLRRRRRALLRLRDKRRRDLSRLEVLASEFLAPVPAPQPPASPPVAADAAASSSASILDDRPPVAADAAASSSASVLDRSPVAAADADAASSSAASVLDELLVQVDMLGELMKKAREWCDRANAACDAREAAVVDSIASLPMWGGNPMELMAGLSIPSPGNLDEQSGRKEAVGVSSEAAEMKKTDDDLPPPILIENRKSQREGITSTVLDTPASTKKRKEDSIKKQKAGHDLPPSLTESRLRKRIHPTSGSNVTPGSTRMKANPTPARAPFVVGSPGALTRRRTRRSTAEVESPTGQNVL